MRQTHPNGSPKGNYSKENQLNGLPHLTRPGEAVPTAGTCKTRVSNILLPTPVAHDSEPPPHAPSGPPRRPAAPFPFRARRPTCQPGGRGHRPRRHPTPRSSRGRSCPVARVRGPCPCWRRHAARRSRCVHLTRGRGGAQAHFRWCAAAGAYAGRDPAGYRE